MNDIHKNIEEEVRKFQSTSLEEMDGVKLMNRTDTKFIFKIEHLPEILKQAEEYYKILEINDQRLMNYKTVYFDTEDFRLYHAHQNGKLNRYKIRQRTYCITGTNFFEIKFKDNKRKTHKTRICLNPGESGYSNVSEQTKNFLNIQSPYKQNELEEKLTNYFSRIMLVHKTDKERITLDLNLYFQNDFKEKKLPYLVIAEVKQEGYSSASSFIQILRKHNIYPTGISKYCMGTIYLNPSIKHNRFKVKLLTINKLRKNDTGYYSGLSSSIN